MSTTDCMHSSLVYVQKNFKLFLRKAYGQNEKYSTYCMTVNGNALAKKIF